MVCTKNACVDIEVETIPGLPGRPSNSDIPRGKNHDILTLENMVVCRDRVEVGNLFYDDTNLPSYTINNTYSKYNDNMAAEMKLNNKNGLKVWSIQQ
ncbi:hypothetical protein JTB14_022322 [Gonioctena quinquepunctata]|nr:hypothetical protein JTB14_022322 [Gonioctena quinquepunctata]